MNKYIILVTFIILVTYFQTRVPNTIDTARHRAPDNEVTAKNNEKNIFLLELIEK